jgi:hypothetical protein
VTDAEGIRIGGLIEAVPGEPAVPIVEGDGTPELLPAVMAAAASAAAAAAAAASMCLSVSLSSTYSARVQPEQAACLIKDCMKQLQPVVFLT